MNLARKARDLEPLLTRLKEDVPALRRAASERLPSLPSLAPRARPPLAGALGAVALGALAFGALAIGALAVGRLAIGKARLRRLHVDRLTVDSLEVRSRSAVAANPPTPFDYRDAGAPGRH